MTKKNKQKRAVAMRSADAQYKLSVIKRVNLGHIPLFVQLAHKGLEKSVQEGTKCEDGTSFNIPKDILALSVSNPTILEAIESIEFVYKKAAK